jgi:predicted enzyme related to lactoylglutathione lyase/AcrR family transcriptional regulator
MADGPTRAPRARRAPDAARDRDTSAEPPARAGSGRRYGGQPPDVRRAARRERLLQAGLDLFGTRGYSGVTISGLCATAGVAPAKFYEEFVSKDAVLIALGRELVSESLDAISEAIDEAENELAATTRAGLGALCHYFLDDPRRARILLIEMVGVSDQVEAERRAHLELYSDVLIQFFQTVPRDRSLDPILGTVPVRTTALALVGGANQAMVGWLLDPGRQSIDELAEVLSGIYLVVGEWLAANHAATDAVLRSPRPPSRPRSPLMSERTSYLPGTPSWVDIGVPDTAKAAEFYGAIFGWDAAIDPRPEAGGYGMFTIDGKNVAGLGPQQNMDMPPFWSVYVTVADLNASVEAATAAGATTIAGPMDVFDAGSMAVIQDAVGSFISMWQPKEHIGAQLVNQPGTFAWNELATTDIAAARDFYTKVFGWGVEDSASSDTAAIFTVDGNVICGAHAAGPGEFPAWTVWFSVNDCDATAAQVKELGGAVFMEPNDMDFGRGAVVADPAGAVFGIGVMNEPA